MRTAAPTPAPRAIPRGLIRQIDDTTIALADRPGNRRTDTLHNLMDDPRIALLAMAPGSRHVAEVRGTARVCTGGALLESMRLRDRTPKVALVIDVDHRELRDELALSAADLWSPSRRAADAALPPAATIWADHVRRNGRPRHRRQSRPTPRQQDGAGGRCRLRLPDHPLIDRRRRWVHLGPTLRPLAPEWRSP